MADPTPTPDIPEEAVFDGVTAFDRRLLAHDTDIEEFEQHMGPSAAEVVRDVLAAALPHLADQPATTDPVAVDALIAEHAAKFQQVYDQRTAGDHTFTGALAIFAYDLVPLLRRQSADRDTETAALRAERRKQAQATMNRLDPDTVLSLAKWLHENGDCDEPGECEACYPVAQRMALVANSIYGGAWETEPAASLRGGK